MTDLGVRAQAAPSLQAGAGLEAVGGLVPLLTSGVVCEGDSCFVPGAEGDWTEVPDQRRFLVSAGVLRR